MSPVPPGASETVDVAIVGAGLRGLLAALRHAAARPEQRLLVLDAAPQPGGSVRTHRTNGFVCELGPFAFTERELEPFAALLPSLPPRVACLPDARTGHLFDGSSLQPVAVDPPPFTFRTGNEELVQACRRALDGRLRLGRAVTTIAMHAGAGPGGGTFTLALGGEVPAELHARQLVLAVPEVVAATLLARFDPALAAVAARVPRVPGAMVFLGGDRGEAAALRGYGFVPAPGVATAVAEIVCCSEVFPGRALPGRFLVRAELSGEAATGSDDAVAAAAERELRRWTGTAATFGLRKVHRFETHGDGGAAIECRTRLRDLPRRVPGLALA